MTFSKAGGFPRGSKSQQSKTLPAVCRALVQSPRPCAASLKHLPSLTINKTGRNSQSTWIYSQIPGRTLKILIRSLLSNLIFLKSFPMPFLHVLYITDTENMLGTNVWVEELKERSGKEAGKAVKDETVTWCQTTSGPELLRTRRDAALATPLKSFIRTWRGSQPNT